MKESRAVYDAIIEMTTLGEATSASIATARAAVDQLVANDRISFGAIGGEKNDCNERSPFLVIIDSQSKAAIPLELKVCRR